MRNTYNVFVCRQFQASRLSGYDPDDAEDLKEFEELNKKRELGVDLSLLDRAKIFMEKTVEKVGFFGILACASVSYPLNFPIRHCTSQLCQYDNNNVCSRVVLKIHRYQIHCSIWLASRAATFWYHSGRSLVQHCWAKLSSKCTFKKSLSSLRSVRRWWRKPLTYWV